MKKGIRVWLMENLNRFISRSWHILRYTIERFNETDAPQAAAAAAYYALFSLFPLLLVLITLGSVLIENARVQRQVINFAIQTVPVSQDFIRQNMANLLETRGPVGLIGLVGLLWAATGFFDTIAYQINLAWETSEGRNFLKRRLVALAIVGGLALLLIVSILSTAVLDLVGRLNLPITALLPIDPGWLEGYSRLLPIVLRFLTFLGLYRWVPNTTVAWRVALWGALVAALGWEASTIAFTWYVGSGLVQYELLYGSLGTVIAMMLWIYLGSLITLFGAHLSVAISRQYQL